MITGRFLTENSLTRRLAINGSEKKSHRRMKYAILIFLIILVAALMTVGTFFISERLEPHFAWLKEFKTFGLLGIFLIAFISNAFIIVALPIGFSLAIAVAPPNEMLLVVVIYAVGAVLGESVAYFLGVAGKKNYQA